MRPPEASLVLRLAGPLQSWGDQSQFNHRYTGGEPTKSGITGLLAAADGRRRSDPIEDLVGLCLAVRTDQPGSMLRDYHTVSDLPGRPLLSASVNDRGVQKRTSPAKPTHVTERFYLQDAIFVVAIAGEANLLGGISEALRNPAFPLSLGRRSCVPTQPLLLVPPMGMQAPSDATLWDGPPLAVLERVPWQLPLKRVRAFERKSSWPTRTDLPVTIDDPNGNDIRTDLPGSFDPQKRSFGTRRVRQVWVSVERPPRGQPSDMHDPFVLLGG